MRAQFEKVSLPATADELVSLIEAAFESLTGHALDEDEPFFVERFSHGGMSSGYIQPDFWRNKAIPLLRTRFDEASRSVF